MYKEKKISKEKLSELGWVDDINRGYGMHHPEVEKFRNTNVMQRIIADSPKLAFQLTEHATRGRDPSELPESQQNLYRMAVDESEIHGYLKMMQNNRKNKK